MALVGSDLCHGVLEEVMPLSKDPLLVLCQDASGDETQEGGVVREHPCHVGAGAKAGVSTRSCAGGSPRRS